MSRRSSIVVGSATLAVVLASSAHAVISPLLNGTEPTPAPTNEALVPAPPSAGPSTELPAIEPVQPPAPEPAPVRPEPAPMQPEAAPGVKPAAPQPSGFGLEPWVMPDPNAPNANVSRWEPTSGLPDGNGGLRSAVRLQKFTGTFTDSGAHLRVTGVKGITLNELGFDLRNDGHTGAGAPRFTIVTQDGLIYAFSFRAGGINRPWTPAPGDPANWKRIRFRDQDAYPQYVNQKPWPGFGKAVIEKINICFDEGLDQGNGYAYVDNVDINGVILGKPTPTKSKAQVL